MARILHLTDTHLRAAPELIAGRVDPRACLARLAARLAALMPQIGPFDLCLLTGDLADLGTPAEYAALREGLSGLDAPLAVLPGNHDDRRALAAAFPELGLPPEGPQDWCRDVGAVRVVGLDSVRPGADHGALSEQSLSFLADRLAEAPDRPALVALHHPPFDTGIDFMDVIGLRNAAALAAAVVGHQAELRIVCGHVHRHMTGMCGGWPVVIGPAVAHMIEADYRPDSPAAFTLEPGGCLIHEWDRGFRSTHVFAGEAPGPYPF